MLNFDPLRPYDDLPALPPAADIESKAILKACIRARAALGALKEATGLIPNPAVLINTIPLLEAQASSEIENIVTTADALFRFAQFDEESADGPTKEALRYRTALSQGFKALRERPLCTATAEKVCSTIKGRGMAIRRVPGTALGNRETGDIVYTPPVGEALIRTKLGNWERFLHERAELDPLVRMAVGHYQFEAIHPFADGNGRTGRILNLLFLISEGLLDVPVLYLSRYILKNRADYYRLLNAVTRDQAWEDWIVYMLDAVAETAGWTTDKIHAVRKLMQHTVDYARDAAPKIYSRELLDLIFVQPYCRIQNVIDAGIARRQTASVYLKALVDIGILEELKIGREKLFIHPKFANLLTRDGSRFAHYAVPATARRKDA
ncbi:MAG: Fic family protein [Nevskia sp.]